MEKSVVLFCLTALFSPIFVFSQQDFTLDASINQRMNDVFRDLPDGKKVSVLKFKKSGKELMYIVDGSSEDYMPINMPISLADNRMISFVFRHIYDKGGNDNSAEDEILRTARAMNADSASLGEFSQSGNYYKFFVQVFDAKTGEIKGIQSFKVKPDKISEDYIWNKYFNYSFNKIAGGETTFKDELEESEALTPNDYFAEFQESKNIIDEDSIGNYGDENYIAEVQKSDSAQIDSKADKAPRYFVFSLRPEFSSDRLIMTVGADMEFGSIGRNGFYFSIDFSGGAIYYGGGLNFGGCLNKDGSVKSVFGFSGGFWDVPISVNKSGTYSHTEHNHNFGSIFWKLMFGTKGNFDITNKALFGTRERWEYDDSVDESVGGFIYLGDNFNITYSLSVGYTLTKRKKR